MKTQCSQKNPTIVYFAHTSVIWAGLRGTLHSVSWGGLRLQLESSKDSLTYLYLEVGAGKA